MFLGHYAIALAAKKPAPATGLGTMILAAQLVDLLWPVLLLAGLEEVAIVPGVTTVSPLDFVRYPYTHSLLAVLGWGVLFGGVYFLLRRDGRGAWVAGAAVLSHWVLDLVVHRPDLPLYPDGAPRVGLGLWNSVPGTLVVEFGLLAAGAAVYLRTTTARDRTGRIALWALLAVLVLVYALSLVGPLPPSPQAVAVAALAGWLFVPWGYWIDRHRQPATAG